MLGLVLLYYVGKYFFDLAGQYKKNKWLYAILGVVSYYGGLFAAGLGIGILAEMGVINSFENIPEIVLSLIALPFGVLTCWLFYVTLKSQWSKKTILNNENVLDSEFL